MRTCIMMLIGMVVTACVAGCSANTQVETAAGGTEQQVTDGNDHVVLGLRQKLELKMVADAARQRVTDGNNHFALELYQKLRTAEGNLFFSPYSISTALAMTYAGARSETARQMAEAIYFPTTAKVLEKMGVTGTPMTPEKFALTFGTIVKDLNARGSQGKYQLSVANALWGQKDYAFLPAFVKLVESAYGGKLEAVDFRRAAEKTRQTINAWVATQTNGKIRKLIEPGMLDSMTRLVLTNAIYFKGNWAVQFKEDRTHPAPFTLLDGKEIQTPMMNQKDKFRYTETDELQILELPYVDEELSMVILLPRATDGIGPIEEELTPENLSNWLKDGRKQEVIVSIPKFKMTRKFDLARVLASMGMGEAFSGDADFSGMTDRRELFISAVIHQAYVDVNEEGTEAAAATGVAVSFSAVMPGRTPVFRADHPFIFMIRDNASGGILFLGRVMNPELQK